MHTKIENIIQARYKRSRDRNILLHHRCVKVVDVVHNNDDSFEILIGITNDLYRRHLLEVYDRYVNQVIPDSVNHIFLYSKERLSSISVSALNSKQIRLTLHTENLLCNTKQLTINEGEAVILYKKIGHIKNIQNKTKLLRLIHRDVYCRARLMRFGMTENDRCQHCFEAETIRHLLIDCPYSVQVWSMLHIQPTCLADIILNINNAEIEIMAEILSELVFRKKVIPPNILIRNIYKNYAEGLCRNKSMTQLAKYMLANLAH